MEARVSYVTILVTSLINFIVWSFFIIVVNMFILGTSGNTDKQTEKIENLGTLLPRDNQY